jgi:cysteinyl-tRNA synthetase
MMLQVYSTLTRKKEPFVTREPGRAGMYVCGVNPYDYCHMGHARCYVAFDIVRRWLEFSGYQVTHVQNFTDIEDNILQRARESGRDWRELVESFIQAYFEDLDALSVLRAHHYPKATDFIPQMISIIQSLMDKGVAYPVDGDVYLEIDKIPDYGKLSRRRLEEMLPGARVEPDPRKRDPLDFALWKAAKPGEPSWESPWGPGRPGWHIECSAMSTHYLGNGFEIHGGGLDLIFPHHEDEIAQSESATGQQFVRYWLHNGWVTVNREKMSKSLGNFFTIREVLARYRPQVVRLLLLTTHYRRPLEFSDSALDQAKSALERLEIALLHIARLLSLEPASRPPGGSLAGLNESVEACRQAFRESMDDDFNTSRAIGAIFDLVAELNRLTAAGDFVPTAEDRRALEAVRQAIVALTGVLGIALEEAGERPAAPTAVPPDFLDRLRQAMAQVHDQALQQAQQAADKAPLLNAIAAQAATVLQAIDSNATVAQVIEAAVGVRTLARQHGQFALGDAIRSRLHDLGVILEDHPEGTTWRWA